MLLSFIFVCISLWYVYKTYYKHIPAQSIYAFVLMLIYIVIYFYTPFVQGEYSPLKRYIYIFTYFPLFAYYMILFPRSVLIPTEDFFPKLSGRLAIDATIVMAWLGLLLMFVLLLGLRFF